MRIYLCLLLFATLSVALELKSVPVVLTFNESDIGYTINGYYEKWGISTTSNGTLVDVYGDETNKALADQGEGITFVGTFSSPLKFDFLFIGGVKRDFPTAVGQVLIGQDDATLVLPNYRYPLSRVLTASDAFNQLSVEFTGIAHYVTFYGTQNFVFDNLMFNTETVLTSASSISLSFDEPDLVSERSEVGDYYKVSKGISFGPGANLVNVSGDFGIQFPTGNASTISFYPSLLSCNLIIKYAPNVSESTVTSRDFADFKEVVGIMKSVSLTNGFETHFITKQNISSGSLSLNNLEILTIEMYGDIVIESFENVIMNTEKIFASDRRISFQSNQMALDDDQLVGEYFASSGIHFDNNTVSKTVISNPVSRGLTNPSNKIQFNITKGIMERIKLEFYSEKIFTNFGTAELYSESSELLYIANITSPSIDFLFGGVAKTISITLNSSDCFLMSMDAKGYQDENFVVDFVEDLSFYRNQSGISFGEEAILVNQSSNTLIHFQSNSTVSILPGVVSPFRFRVYLASTAKRRIAESEQSLGFITVQGSQNSTVEIFTSDLGNLVSIDFPGVATNIDFSEVNGLNFGTFSFFKTFIPPPPPPTIITQTSSSTSSSSQTQDSSTDISSIPPSTDLPKVISPQSNESTKLSGGAIAGIVIGILALLILLILLLIFLLTRRKRKEESAIEEMGVMQGASQSDPATRIILNLK